MSTERRYVAKSSVMGSKNRGHWRVWDRRTKRWWGNYFATYPEALLDELNGQKRPDVITELCKSSYGVNKNV